MKNTNKWSLAVLLVAVTSFLEVRVFNRGFAGELAFTMLLAAEWLALGFADVDMTDPVKRQENSFRYGENYGRLLVYAAAAVMWLFALYKNSAVYFGADEYLRSVEECIGLNGSQDDKRTYVVMEEDLCREVHMDALRQLDLYSQGVSAGLYEYPTSDDTKFLNLTALCQQINEEIHKLDHLDSSSLDAVQHTTEAIGMVQQWKYRLSWQAVVAGIVSLSTKLFIAAAIMAIIKWFKVNRYIKRNGGLKAVLFGIQQGNTF